MGEVTACQQPQKRGSKAVLLLLYSSKTKHAPFWSWSLGGSWSAHFRSGATTFHFTFSCYSSLISSHIQLQKGPSSPHVQQFQGPFETQQFIGINSFQVLFGMHDFFSCFLCFYVKIYTISMKFILSKRTPNKKDTKKEKKSHIPKGV